ncbi:uncharacterized protein LOC119388848 [Rhipicephalus sanguineus]|uniref:Uncharacterized protein n=1 Tax=Rhipicephalus sanguineus TaxID=34632 RepID=A0A9D4Q048_RHISA|nr:uncharacterized protein LOC119388848 [Rhipicephalus sanguineus]KAH7957558.1 hypothetical protein HPB52_020099 [Rhipicephalus sanguineus]
MSQTSQRILSTSTPKTSRISRPPTESASRTSRTSRTAHSLRRSIATEMTSALSEATANRRPFLPMETAGDLQEEQRGTSTFSWDASLLASSASFFWVLLDVLFKLNPSIPTPKLLFHFSEGIFVGSMTLMSGIAEPYGPLAAQSLLFMRSVAMTGAHFARLFSLRFLTVVDAFTISSLGPVLSELPTCANRKGATVGRVLPLCMGAISLGLLGYSKQYRAPDTTSARRFATGCLLTLTASVLRATVSQFNDATWHLPSVVQEFHFSFVSLIASCVLVVFFSDMRSLYDDIDMGCMVFLAQVSFAYLFSLTKARNLEYYGVVNIFAYGLDAFLSLAASHLVLDEVPGRHSDCAALLVMAAVMIVEACRIGQLHVDSCSHQTWWLVLNLPVLSPSRLQSPAS